MKTVTMSVNGGDPVDVTQRFAKIQYSEKELAESIALVADLLTVNWTGIQKAIADTEESVGSVSLALKLDHTGPMRSVKVRIGYSVKHSDEAECMVKDPTQLELEIEK